MYQHLSASAEKILQEAYQIARQDNCEYLGTEHVLWAIWRHKNSLPGGLLEDVSITAEALRLEVSRHAPDDQNGSLVLGRLPGTPHFTQAMAFAIEEAERMGEGKINPEHILLGLLRETGCVAQKTLHHLGFDVEQARRKIISQNHKKTKS